MASLKPNLVKRIERLPKPTTVSGALIPLFEAVSNAIHSTQSRFGETVATLGQVNVTVVTDRKKANVSATVEDNGDGLSPANWDAFTTTDTDNKIRIGGKGVGRLLWLDCFRNTQVTSVFFDEGNLHRRKFRFVLDNEEQIQDEALESVTDGGASSFHVHFEGLRDNAYFEKFPGRGSFVFQHLTSHFLPVFIGGRSPQITVRVGDEVEQYPGAIERIVHRKSEPLILDTEAYGKLKLTLMECDKVASSDMKGQHFVHFIAHDRTVHSQPIDE